MGTNLAIDDDLIEEARRIGGHPTKRQAVTVALQEYVARRKQIGIIDLFGTIDFDPAYNSRANRDLDRIEGRSMTPMEKPVENFLSSPLDTK